jgi:hypothetical protein
MTQTNIPPEGSIVITPKEFYDDVRLSLADIKNAVSPLPALVADVDELKRRVTALEARVLYASGFAAAVGVAGGFLVPQLLK